MIQQVEQVNKYYITDMDTVAYPYYFGYLNDEGKWYIMKLLADGTARYNKASFQGVGLYSAAWINRVNLIYTYWSEGF